MTYSSRKNLQGLFFTEASGYHLQVEEILGCFTEGGDGLNKGHFQELHRLFHNIKGASAQVDLPNLSETAWLVELALEDVAYHLAPFSRAFARVLSDLSTAIYQYCKRGTHDLSQEQSILRNSKVMLKGFLQNEDIAAWPNIAKLLNTDDKGETAQLKHDDTERLVGLLHKYSVLLVDGKIDFDDAMLEEFQQGICALRDFAQYSQQEQKENLLHRFNQFLEAVRSAPLTIRKDLPPLINQLFEFLQVFDSADSQASSRAMSKITEGICRVGESFAPSQEDDISQLLDNPESDFLVTDSFEETSFSDELFADDVEFVADDFTVNEDSESLLSEPSFDSVELPDASNESAALVDEDDEEFSLQEIFYAECEEHIATINMAMLVIDQGGDDEDGIRKALSEMRRAIHTLKGAAGMTGFTDLSGFAHLSEDFLDGLYESSTSLTTDIASLLSEIVTVLEALAYRPETVQQTDIEAIRAEIDAQLAEIQGGDVDSERDQGLVGDDGLREQPALAAQPEVEGGISGPTDNVLVQLEKIDELQVLGGDIVTTRNAMVGFLDDLHQTLNELEVAKDKLRKISNELDEGFEIQALHGFGAGTGAQANQAVGEDSEFDVMELDRYSELSLIIRSLNETSVDLGSVHSGLQQAAGNIRGQLSRQELTTRVTQNRLMRIRMTPLSSVSRVFFQNVRSTAKALEKKVQLQIDGEDIYLDRFIWKKISDPIMHILRNSIDHGIENPELRRSVNKPEQGRITIQTTQRGNAVVLRIHDDGAGINLHKLQQTLINKEIVTADHKLTDQQLLQYLFHTGITTKDEVSLVSGRGVGLDVVYKNIHDLKGSVLVHSEPGKGTTFEINVPISLSINKGIIISDNDRLFAVPLQDIEEVIGYSSSDQQSEKTIEWRGESVEKIDLGDLLGTGQAKEGEEKQLAIVFACGSKHKAVVINSVHKQQEIVVKNLGSHLAKVVGVSGVTDLGDGVLIPILDLVELSEKEKAIVVPRAQEVTTHFEKESLHVLVVDDSISVRQSVMRLMKTQGWVVTQAKDGVDALEKLQNVAVDIIVSDIEMPRMNGYEFKESLNNSAELREIPLLMLTSRVSTKHKQKATDLGVQGFVTKPYKDDEFVALVRQLASQ